MEGSLQTERTLSVGNSVSCDDGATARVASELPAGAIYVFRFARATLCQPRSGGFCPFGLVCVQNVQ